MGFFVEKHLREIGVDLAKDLPHKETAVERFERIQAETVLSMKRKREFLEAHPEVVAERERVRKERRKVKQRERRKKAREARIAKWAVMLLEERMAKIAIGALPEPLANDTKMEEDGPETVAGESVDLRQTTYRKQQLIKHPHPLDLMS
jgi:hypothetical protein